MPRIEVVFYRDPDGEAPVLRWLEKLRRSDRSGYARCAAAVSRLADFGHELRRPAADYLRDGIHELRIRRGRVNYRLLYFFYGADLAVLAHSLAKEDRIPEADLDRAIRRKRSFEQNPPAHIYSQAEEQL